jgi:starch phosphorylase
MWQPLFPERPVDAVPIGYVTNGVHLPTWMAPRMRDLLDRALGEGWVEHADDPETWKGVDDISDEDLWSARTAMREEFVAFVRDRSVASRLARGEQRWYVEAAERGFEPGALTIGFARRLASYKRIALLTMDPQRVADLLGDAARPVQVVLAGKAHPQDEEGKRAAQGLFGFRRDQAEASRLSFLDNYSLATALNMVAGCDVWINVPRPPLEASGTSGMKSALNGGLNLSVLDGWWAEAYDGTNGWALEGEVDDDHRAQDERDALALHALLDEQVVPTFYERDGDGVPHEWIARMRASLRTLGPRFGAARMLAEYLDGPYRAALAAAAAV